MNSLLGDINTLMAGLRIHRIWVFSPKPAVFSCLTNPIAPLPIVLESCSNSQKIRQVF